MSSQYPVPKWIEQLHAGKEEAYRILFDEYYQMLCVFAMKYIKDKEVAEDIVQDIILELYSRRLRFNTPVALKSFLFLSVKNRALNFLRRQRAQEHYLSISVEEESFFLNNIMNHGILVPLGMSQAEQTGGSLLFLLETNPGPGLGMLLGLLLYKRKNVKRRQELATAAFTQAIGGIHEVYFPFVLADLGLLLPLIVGGVAGSIWFSVFHCETAGVISPGSVLTILIMAGRSSMLPVLGGILVSTAVSGVGSYLYLCWRGERKEVPQSEIPESEKQEELEKENTEMSGLERELETASEQEEKPMPENIYQNLHKIGFVCNGGMGSSAMGAALFRRALKTAGITGIQVGVYAADLIEEDIDLIVCQKEFYALNPQLHEKVCHVIAGFTDREEYTKLIQCIQDAQNGGTR